MDQNSQHDMSITEEKQVYDHLELLSEMSADFASTLDINASLMRAVAHITSYVGAEGGALFMLEEDGTRLVCRACVGPSDITGLSLPSDQGIVGRSVQDNRAEMIRDAQNDKRFYKGIDEESGTTTLSILCAPMSVKDERIGAIELINKKSDDGLFEEHDLHLLSAMASSAALAVLNARMAEALVEQERLARELELAAEIQRSLLPDEPAPGYPIAGVNFPARTVSGDFFDFFELDDGRICFNLGDVSGKGMNAALLMAKTASLYRCLGKTIESPGKLLARVNEEICETAARGMFVTMIGGIYDPRTRQLVIANAGHEPPLVQQADGSFDDLPADAPPIGISPFLVGDEGYPEETIDLLDAGFFVFTDGVTEGYMESGAELEVEGVKAALSASRGRPIGERLSEIAALIYRGGETLRDDLTLVGIDGAVALEMPETPPETLSDAGGQPIAAIKVPSRPDRLRIVRQMVREAAALAGFGDAETRDIVLVVDEALQNVIRHGYGGADDGEIEVTIGFLDDSLAIDVRDWAPTVDPATVKPRDLDDIRPGGLGTHIIREIMDEVAFLTPPKDGGNLLRMVKRLQQSQPNRQKDKETGESA
jgi:sigma-B regulation protein RsbU (phosphoserine phosphatase)